MCILTLTLFTAWGERQEIVFLHTSFPTYGWVDEADLDSIYVHCEIFPDGNYGVKVRSGATLNLYYDDGVSVYATLTGGDYVNIGRPGEHGTPGESYPQNMSCVGYSKDGGNTWLGTGSLQWVDTGIKKYGSGQGAFGFVYP